ncbi:hypothetical protein [Flexivirga meconopsidis]|uniref:hypothetical protein n=1 Tax=Flexivirga meconopsidis TaxID=2977121 RepID=UPI00223FC6DC|nr:hypothetical protein [Flexivirga meconopsidis]
MSQPETITAGLFSVRFRDDVPREVAVSHWEHQHADIMRHLPHIDEYRQRQFSAVDHGYWPATPGVGTTISPEYRLDGFAEIRWPNMLGIVRTSFHSSQILHDEQNLFRHVVGQLAPRRGRWWPDESTSQIGQHTAVMLRRRQGASRGAFARFVHDELGPALHEAGARDLRTYTFVPSSKVAATSPGVSHQYAVERRIHGGVSFGLNDRGAVDSVLQHPSVAAVIEGQSEVLTGAYAYTIERSDTVIDNVVRHDRGRHA